MHAVVNRALAVDKLIKLFMVHSDYSDSLLKKTKGKEKKKWTSLIVLKDTIKEYLDDKKKVYLNNDPISFSVYVFLLLLELYST